MIKKKTVSCCFCILWLIPCLSLSGCKREGGSEDNPAASVPSDEKGVEQDPDPLTDPTTDPDNSTPPSEEEMIEPAFGLLDLDNKLISLNLNNEQVILESIERFRYHEPIRLEPDNAQLFFGADLTLKNISSETLIVHLCIDEIAETQMGLIEGSLQSVQRDEADCKVAGLDFGVLEPQQSASRFLHFLLSDLNVLGSTIFDGRVWTSPAQAIRCAPNTIPESTIGTWVRTKGPPGGGGYDIMLDPMDADRIFISDIHGGVLLSTNGGDSWAPINNGINVRGGDTLDDITIFSVAVDPSDKNIVWAGSIGDVVIYKSVDGGQTWAEKITGFPEELLDNAGSVRSFEVHPTNSDIVFAGLGFSPSDENGERGLILKTTDGGENWSEVHQSTAMIRYIRFDPENPSIVYASSGMSDRVSQGPQGIFKSTDEGVSWNQINKGIDEPLFPITGFLMDAENSRVLYAATHSEDLPPTGAIYRSTDAGANWTKIHEKTPGGANFVGYFSIAQSPTDHKTLLVGINSPQGVVKTTDGGDSWSLHPIKYRGESFDYLIGLRFLPDGKTVLATDGTGGMWKSVDTGETWEPIGKGLSGSEIHALRTSPSDAVTLVANSGGPNTIPFLSRDGGETWCGLGFENISGINDGPTVLLPDETLLNGESYGKLQRSTDYGVTWDTVSTTFGLSIQNGRHILSDTLRNDPNGDDNQGQIQKMTAIEFASSDSKVVYASAYPVHPWEWTDPDDKRGRGIFRSNDGGLTWERKDAGMEATNRKVTALAVFPDDPDHVLAALLGEGIWESKDRGELWTRIDNQWSPSLAADTPVRSISIHSGNNLLITLGTGRGNANGQGAFYSLDGGKAWSQAGGIEAIEVVNTIVRDPNNQNRLFASGAFSGVWQSEDGGKTYDKFNTGLEHLAVRSLAINSDGSFLFAGTYGQSVWRLRLK